MLLVSVSRYLKRQSNLILDAKSRSKDKNHLLNHALVSVSRYLKRQSNLILDAKSRSKRGGKRR